MAWLTAQSRNRWRWVGIGLALLGALLAIALRSAAATGAEGDGCIPNCVILIQVDGLEPKDVNPQTTPYMWALAHPRLEGQNVPGGGALNNRSGWIWQAPRGVVSTGTGPATASLLTGGFPEKTGVPSDDFIDPEGRQRLGAEGFGDWPTGPNAPDAAQALAPKGLPVSTIIEEVSDAGGETGVFLGDPGLARLLRVVGDSSQANVFWSPPGDDDTAAEASGQYTGDPRLCPIPRYPDRGEPLPNQGDNQNAQGYDPRTCPANDLTTASKAVEDLSNDAYDGVGFTFVHLAELGAAKRRAGDPDVDSDPDGQAPPQPAQALSNADAAIGMLVERLAADNEDKWRRTTVMVVGSHGYQPTPAANRVPDPRLSADPEAPNANFDPTRGVDDYAEDLSDYVAEFSAPGVPPGSLKLIPQGTTATIYAADPGSRKEALSAIKADLERDEQHHPGQRTSVNRACSLIKPELENCIADVLYVDKSAASADETVDGKHPTWHLAAPARASGDLVVLLGRGWAAGRAGGLPAQGVTPKPVTNPYTASSGGPQERAVAALINGPAVSTGGSAVVRDLDAFAGATSRANQVKYYPASTKLVNPMDADDPPPVPPESEQECPETNTDPGGLGCANHPTKVVDDAEKDGHKAQPVTVDFASTISALMGLPFADRPDQLQGRVLQEAFQTALARPCFEDCEPVEVVQEEPLPPELPPPPVQYDPPSDPFPFYGLVQKLKAHVVDSRGRTWRAARRGSVLSTIRMAGDFGKPEAAVTLTFYRRSTTRTRRQSSRTRRPSSRTRRPSSRTRRQSRMARSRRVVRLKPIARFDPFVVKRGHVTMRLKVPRMFKPQYVGITVRQIALNRNGRRLRVGAQPCTKLKTRKRVPFRCLGPMRGVIVRIGDAGRLHKRKGGARPTPRRRR